MDTSIAIIGLGAHFPGARGVPAFRRMIREGRVHVRPVPGERWDHSAIHSPNRKHANKTPAQAGAFVDGFDQFAPEFFGITPKRARLMDPQQRLVLEVSRHALEDAGYSRRPLAAGRVGVYVGASTSDHCALITSQVNLPCNLAGRTGIAPALPPGAAVAAVGALPPIQAYTIVGQQLNMIAANVSQAFDFHGPAFTVDTACSSALAALHEAALHLRHGTVDAALVGGVYVQLEPTMMVCFSRIGALSFSDHCRPFQAAADGFVLGEGAGMIVMKRLADAQRDGDRVIAVLRGIAMNNDGRGTGPLTPNANGQAAAIAEAWRMADCDRASVGLLEAHATATPAGDGIELDALTRVFSSHVRAPVALSSVKANIGHGLASAGMASLLKATLAVHDGFLPPQPVSGPLREEFSGSAAWLRIPRASEPWTTRAGEPRRAGVSAFGFGGTNVHLVLEESRPVAATRSVVTAPHRFAFSAPTRALLAQHLAEVEDALRCQPQRTADVAFTLAQRRSDPVTASFMASSETELLAQLGALRTLATGTGELPVALEGDASSGQLVILPPSPLAQRRFWLIDASKTAAAPAAAALSTAALAITEAIADRAIVESVTVTDGTLGREKALSLVIATVTEVTSTRPEDVRPEQRFVHDLGFDSLTTLELITALGRSLPGMTPPPRTLFTPELTVAVLAQYLGAQAAAAPSRAASGVTSRHVFSVDRHPWLHAHRPGGRARLPMTALLQAAHDALAVRFAQAFELVEFKICAPVDATADQVTVQAEVAPDLSFTLRAEGHAQICAEGSARLVSGETARLEVASGTGGALALATFYAEFAFHDPALRALDALPATGAATACGQLRAGLDEIAALDGALQLGLYLLAANRGRTALATGFASFRRFSAWPAEGGRCRAVLTAETDDTFRGDFDLYSHEGNLVAQWRGVEGQVLAATAGRRSSGAGQLPEVQALRARKAALAAAGFTMPYFQVHSDTTGATTRMDGREFINFSSYNYLGLSGDPLVNQAAADAAARYGTSASASRVASGERPLHGELERALADFLGCEEALVLVSGHSTNVAVLGHLFGPEDLIIHDSLAHDSIITGARLSGARRLAFAHNDMAALADLLARERPKARRALIAVEGVYSMDGDLAPLPEIVRLKHRYDAFLLVDEAHSLGVLGETGRGIGEHFGTTRSDVDLWMGTLSKSLASCGGYVAGSAALIDYLRFTTPGFLYSVGLPPMNAAAALAALHALRARPELPGKLRAASDRFRHLCRAKGVDIGTSEHSAVVPCITGASDRALLLAEALRSRGINVQPIFYPAVDEGKARLRFFVTSDHTEEQLHHAADLLGEQLSAWQHNPSLA